MKVLWFSNYYFSDVPDRGTGTWLGTMGRALNDTGNCQLYNITTGRGKAIRRCDCGAVGQWLLPNWRLSDDGLPTKRHLEEIKAIVDEVKPDIIHVWGVESYYGLLIARGVLSAYRALLDMQGIRFAVGNFFMGNLTFRRQLASIGPKEVLRKATLWDRQRRYLNAESFEIEMIRGFRHVAYQSDWVLGYLNMLKSPDARLHPTKILVRDAFLNSPVKWTRKGRVRRVIFSLCGASVPYKGTHVLVRALYYLRNRGGYDDVELHIGGGLGRGGLLKNGYLRMIEHEILTLGLQDRVKFLNALNAEQIRDELLGASVFVNPSFVESYSLALAEAMAIGCPAVASHAGAMPELATDEVSALYFPAGDSVLCAERIARILDSDSLSTSLSAEAIKRTQERGGKDAVLARQLEIYRDVFSGTVADE